MLAVDRLANATGLSAAADIADFETAWSDFLIASNVIYLKLKEGAKGSGKCEAWFGQKCNLRSKDRCYVTFIMLEMPIITVWNQPPNTKPTSNLRVLVSQWFDLAQTTARCF